MAKEIPFDELSNMELEAARVSDNFLVDDDRRVVVDRTPAPPAPAPAPVDVPEPPAEVRQRLEQEFQPPASRPSPDKPAEAQEHEKEQAVVEISENDRSDYLRCALGLRRFRKTYELYDGQIRLTVQERTVGEEQQIARLIMASSESITANSNLRLLGLASSAIHLVSSGGDALPAEWEELSLEDRLQIIRDLPSALTVPASQELVVFDTLCAKLREDALDPKSWKTSF